MTVLPLVTAYAKDMVMVTPRAPESIEGKWFRLIYSEAFSRLGWRFIYEQYPSKRCAMLSNSGVVDGEMERVVSFNDAYPNLIRVEERLQTINLVAYSTNNALELNGWESLKNKNLLVGYRRGVKLCEQKLPTVVGPATLDDVSKPEQGILKLHAGFIDIYVDFESVMAPVLESRTNQTTSIYRVGELEKIATHPFLHYKHRALVPALAAVLKTMKQEGLIDQYWQQAKTK